MKSEITHDGETVTSQNFNRVSSTKEEAIRERTTDAFEIGVVEDSQFLAETQPFDIIAGTDNAVGFPTIWVKTGLAYSPIGERIVISIDSDLYDSAKPATLTDDGIGGFTNTPQSTGSKNIPLTTSSTNRIWLGYLQTLDPLVFSLHDITTKRLFTKAGDGYEIKVTTTNINPDSTRFIKIAEVLTTTTLGTIDVSVRTFFKTKQNRVQIKIDSASRPDTYSDGQTKFLDDHIDAVGTGTITKFNAHGLAAVDLGISDPTIHQQRLHADGISSPDPSRTSSSLYASVQVFGATNDDNVIIRKLVSDEVVSVNGVTITSGHIPSDLSFVFVDGSNNPIAAGTYTFYVDNVDKTVKRSAVNEVISDVDKLSIWKVEWFNAGPSYDLRTPVTLVTGTALDVRSFGNLSRFNIRQELLGGLITGTATGNRTFTYTYGGPGGRISAVAITGDTATFGAATTIITLTYGFFAGYPDAGVDSTLLTKVATTSFGNKTLTTTVRYVTPADPNSNVSTVGEVIS